MNLLTPERDQYGYPRNTPDYERLRQMFSSVISGINFITPTILGYVELPNGVAEISKGSIPLASESFKPMWGVTIVIDGKRSDKSTAVYSYKEVEELIDTLIIKSSKLS